MTREATRHDFKTYSTYTFFKSVFFWHISFMSAANELSDVFIGCIKATHMVCIWKHCCSTDCHSCELPTSSVTPCHLPRCWCLLNRNKMRNGIKSIFLHERRLSANKCNNDWTRFHPYFVTLSTPERRRTARNGMKARKAIREVTGDLGCTTPPKKYAWWHLVICTVMYWGC